MEAVIEQIELDQLKLLVVKKLIIIGSAQADPTVLETTRGGLSDQHIPPHGAARPRIYTPRYLRTFLGNNLQLFGVEHASEGTIRTRHLIKFSRLAHF